MSRSEIDALNTQFVQALERGDAAGIAALYAPDARVMPPGMPAMTGDGIRELWGRFIGMGINGAALKTLSLEEHDDVAIEVGEYEMRVGAALVDNGKYVVVHRRQPDGSWKLGVDIFNSDRPATGE
jgi:ketosteroid isomerase-like protein